jgi:alpha-ketoglutaric semialdehyde dehydrogenase
MRHSAGSSSVRPAADVNGAPALANDSDFGLSAAVFTDDLRAVTAAVERVDVGVPHINSEAAGADPHIPFGGAKQSAYGPKERGRAVRGLFARTKTVYLRSPGGRER